MFYWCIDIEFIDFDTENVQDIEVLHSHITVKLFYFFVSNVIREFKRPDGWTVCSNLKQFYARNSP